MNKVIKMKSISRKDLNAYNVGMEFLNHIEVSLNNFSKDEIEYIGLRAMHKCKVIVGTLNDKWVIIKKGMKGAKPMYAFVGKKLIEFHNEPKKAKRGMSSVEILSKANAREIFSAGMYRPTRKCKSKVKLNDKIKNEQKRIAC